MGFLTEDHGEDRPFQPDFGRQGHAIPWKRSTCLLPQDFHGSVTSSLKCPFAHVKGWMAPGFMNVQEAGSLHGHQDRHQALSSTNDSLAQHAEDDDLQDLVLPQKAGCVVDNLLRRANCEAAPAAEEGPRPKAKCVSESARAAKDGYAEVNI